MIKSVIFDLDDTLYDYKKNHSIAMKNLERYTCCRFSVSIENFNNAFNLARKSTKKDLEGSASEHNRMIYCQKTLENLGLNPIIGAAEMYEVYWSTMLECMEVPPGIIKLLNF